MSVHRSLTAGMEIGYKSLGPGEALPWHLHDAATLCVVFSGRVEEQDARRVRDRSSGDLVFRPQPEPHRNRLSDSGARILTLEIGELAMEELEELGIPRRDPVFLTSPRAARLARLARTELDGDGAAAGLALLGLSYELLSTVVRRSADDSPRPPKWLSRVHDRLRDELQMKPSLEALAQEERVTPYRLSRAFRRYYGTSIGAFLRRLRVDRAMELLADSDVPLVDVALESGFYDQSHLTNVFKQHTGYTPAAFRRQSATPEPLNGRCSLCRD